MSDYQLINADCLEAMSLIEEGAVDAIVTDPPYGLGFMGKAWDHGVPGEPYWREALRIAKPGAHMLAFGGTRTYHRLAVAIEDAGWELRDSIATPHASGDRGDCPWLMAWVYGSGFPKSHDVSKAIDKEAGAEREVVGRRTDRAATPKQDIRGGNLMNGVNGGIDCSAITAPATDAARQWQGWGTALKPAWEPIIVCRKPLIGTVAANVVEHGTGGLNIDACRVGGEVIVSHHTAFLTYDGQNSRPWHSDHQNSSHCHVGRWPANLILDGSDEVLAGFPTTGKSDNRVRANPAVRSDTAGYRFNNHDRTGFDDSGSAARYFYCAKASKADRGEGNEHPTVKPHSLMRYLCRLVTPPGGLIVDPFTGSGSTGKAAIAEGFRFIGFDDDPASIAIASKRLAETQRPLLTA